MQKITFTAIRAPQSKEHQVFSFSAKAEQILQIASIDRIGRERDGTLRGFQRPQVASHIREIRDYLEKDDAVIPNPIVVAFTEKAKVNVIDRGDRIVTLEINLSDGAPGLVVDGQQRLSALSSLPDKDFEIFVSALICKDEAELRRQFVLINNTKPLPKSLIYELLPTVDGLPDRLASRTFAAEFTSKLNYDPNSYFCGEIYQHTNPRGRIRDTIIQKVIMNSLEDGALRELMEDPQEGEDGCFRLISEFYRAVGATFPEAWQQPATAKTSRLIHGAGIQAMGYVMELLFAFEGARTTEEFKDGLEFLKGHTAWTSGAWDLAPGDVRDWKAIQNLHRDIFALATYLVARVRSGLKERRDKDADMVGEARVA
jgi:DGQHR domain-containing protein